MEQLVSYIKEHHKQREDFLRARIRLTHQVKAITRRLCRCEACGYALCKPCQRSADALWKALATDADHPLLDKAIPWCGPLLEAADSLEGSIKRTEKRLRDAARQLPVFPWVESVRGLDALGLAQIVGEAGDLSRYPNPAKLWARMGVGIRPDGTRQRLVKGEQGNYSPARRSILYRVGSSLVFAGGEYKELFDKRKDVETVKAELRGLRVVPAARIPKGEEDRFMSEGHRRNRAQRYMEKRLLRDLWRAWKES